MAAEQLQSGNEPTGNAYLLSRRKRGLDVALSGAAVAPGWAMERLLRLYLDRVLDQGKPYYNDIRLGGGPDGTRTRKLRTMNHVKGHEAVDPNDLFSENNPRIPTKLVEIIRRSRADELPQVRQVLKGEMSFVGIRPVSDRYFEEVRDHVGAQDALKWEKLLKSPNVPAGITSLATVAIMKQNASKLGDYAPLRVEYDLRYPEVASFSTDMRIFYQSIGQTVLSVVRRSDTEKTPAEENYGEPVETLLEAAMAAEPSDQATP